MKRPVSATIAAAFGVLGLVGLKMPHGDVREVDVAAPGELGPGATGYDRLVPSPGLAGASGRPSPGTATDTPPPEPTTRTVTGWRAAAGDHGYVQVRITVVGSELTDITLLEVTTSPRRAVRDAPGILVEEALAAQSADIDNVSGATYTSEAFKESLRSALADV